MKTLDELSDSRNVSVKEAAEIMDVSPPYIREGLKSGRLPIGTAVQISNEKWTYHISPGLLKEYMLGTSLKNYFEENKEILKTILES